MDAPTPLVSYIILFQFLQICYGSNILFIVPTPAFSHQSYFRPIIMNLLSRGHNITYMTSFPINKSNLTNLNEVDLSSVSKHTFIKSDPIIYETFENNPINYMRSMLPSSIEFGTKTLELPQVKEYITNRHKYRFDLVVLETVLISFAGFSGVYECPIVGVTSLANNMYIDYYLRNQAPLTGGTTNNIPYLHPMSFYERVHNFWYAVPFMWEFYLRVAYFDQDRFAKYFGNNFTLFDIIDRINIVMRNDHPILVRPNPNLPGVIKIGGMNNIAAKEMPEVGHKCNL